MAMNLYDNIILGQSCIAIIGLGYVGLPIALAFAQKGCDVIGYDKDKDRINELRRGYDSTGESDDDVIKNSGIRYTYRQKDLEDAKLFIVAVPTPISSDKRPNLNPIEKVSRMIGKYLTKGAMVVYESTVYPGVTEEICIPLLEHISKLRVGDDFKVGYSPERINPGDKLNRLENIIKIVSANDEEALIEISNIYELIIEAGVYRASCIKVAEAAKVVENSQRDINIAYMNEIAMVFDRMKIDTNEVIDAMNTKWNALGFTPGLVGGHCIGVDPYYFIYKAESLGYHSQIIQAGRKINNDMGSFVAEAIIKQLALADKVISRSKVVICGLTFKRNTSDIRNTRVLDIIEGLNKYNISPIVVDPYVDINLVKASYGIEISDIDDIEAADCVVFAVAHDVFSDMNTSDLELMFNGTSGSKIIIDVKGIFNTKDIEEIGYRYWRL